MGEDSQVRIMHRGVARIFQRGGEGSHCVTFRVLT